MKDTPDYGMVRYPVVVGEIMETVTSAEYQRHVGRYHDRALVQPLAITQNGRVRLVVMSEKEYHRLKRRDREVLTPADLSEDSLAALIAVGVPPEHK